MAIDLRAPLLTVLLVTALGGCSSPAAPSVTPTVTVTRPSSAAPPTSSPSGASSDSAPGATQSVTTAGPTDPEPSSTDRPVELERADAPQRVTLSQFYKPDDRWNESAYQVADIRDVRGIGAPVNQCGFNSYSSPPTLDLRLQNRFTQLTFKVGQENFSDSLDQTLVAEVLTDSAQADIRKVRYNQFSEVTVPVAGKGAAELRLALDGDSDACGGEVVGVIYDITLQ